VKVYEHVQHIEEQYWNTDLMIDEEIEMEDDEGSPFEKRKDLFDPRVSFHSLLSETIVTCEFTIDRGLAVGKDDGAVTRSDGAPATLPSAFEGTPELTWAEQSPGG
jgi:hypothetical protein